MGSSPRQRQCRWNCATNCCPAAWRVSLTVRKSRSCPLSVNGHPGDRVHAEEPCGKRSWSPWAGQGPSELRKHEGRKQNWLSVLAALGKPRKGAGTRVHSAARGQAHFSFKTWESLPRSCSDCHSIQQKLLRCKSVGLIGEIFCVLTRERGTQTKNTQKHRCTNLIVVSKCLASARQADFWHSRGREIMHKTGIFHIYGHVWLQTPHKKDTLAFQASITGKNYWKDLQIAFIKAFQRNNFLFFFLFRKGMWSKLRSLCRPRSQVSYVPPITEFSITFCGHKIWELSPLRGVQLEQPPRHPHDAAGVMLPLLCTHSDGQFYVFKGKFSFSLLLCKKAIEKSPVAVLLFALETSLSKHKGRPLHCLISLMSPRSYS